jgi:hypothetical protein
MGSSSKRRQTMAKMTRERALQEKRERSKVEHDFVTAPNPVSRDVFVERGGELVVLSQ